MYFISANTTNNNINYANVKIHFVESYYTSWVAAQKWSLAYPTFGNQTKILHKYRQKTRYFLLFLTFSSVWNVEGKKYCVEAMLWSLDIPVVFFFDSLLKLYVWWQIGYTVLAMKYFLKRFKPKVLFKIYTEDDFPQKLPHHSIIQVAFWRQEKPFFLTVLHICSHW
jgi:hypothetical protein